MAPEPKASRPTPDWVGGKGLLPWTWAVERLAGARHYWIATLRENGLPQARPVDGVWVNGVLGLSIGHGGVQRALQRQDGRFDGTVHTDSAPDVVIVEGTVERVVGRPRADRLPVSDPIAFDVAHAVELYKAKYNEDIPDVVNFAVVPHVVYGWSHDDIKIATKWTFE
jgi:hypothetical protein